MPTSISGTAGVTYPAGGLANTTGAGVGTTDTQTLTNKTLTSPTLTTPNINSAQIATVSGTAPLYMCRAWVNFNGTTNVGGFCTIRASGNVTSVTDNGTGDYTVNFTTALVDANYSANVTADVGGASDFAVACTGDNTTARTTSLVRLRIGTTGGLAADSTVVQVAIFR